MKKVVLYSALTVLMLNGYSQSTWVNLDTASGLINNHAHVICCDLNNDIWVALGTGTDGQGLMKYSNNSWTLYDSSNSSIPSNSVKCMKLDTAGNIWMSYFGGYVTSFLNLTMYDGYQWHVFNTSNSNIISDKINGIFVDSRNNVWISCTEGFAMYNGYNFVNYPLNISPGNFIVQDSAKVWFSYTNGLGLFNPCTLEIDTFTKNNSNIPSQCISSMALDTNKILWLGFLFAFNGGIGYGGSNGGLATFNGSDFTPYWPFLNPYTGVYDLTVDNDNNIWVSTRCEGLYKFNGINWEQIQDVKNDGCSFSLTVDKENFIWYTEGYTGVWTNKTSATSDINEDKMSFSVFPNPATNFLYINSEENATVEILNLQGKSLSKSNIPSNGSVDVSVLKGGVYLVRIKTDNGVVTSKFVKQ